MKTRSFAMMYVWSLITCCLMLAFAVLHQYGTSDGQNNIPFESIRLGLALVVEIAFIVGLIGTIVTSKDRGKAASAVLGLPIGIGLLVIGFFMLLALSNEGLPNAGYMMVFGVIPIPLWIMGVLLPFLGVIALYRSVKIISCELLKPGLSRHR